MTGSIVLLLSYVATVVFLAAIAFRAVRILRLPISMRWELYPVAHEKGRARYGGSYLEEPAWWTKPRRSSRVGELKVMIPEILLLAGVWHHNREHWFRSFPFHFGLYLLAGLIVLLLAGGIATAAGANVSADGTAAEALLYHITYVVGYTGLGLGLIGALALLERRIFNANYREYTKKADYFNLLFFIAALVVALIAHATADPEFAGVRAYFARLVTFDFTSAEAGLPWPTGIGIAEIALASLLIAYIPLTHMSHFFTKWFTYHQIRWSDEPNVRGGKIERQVAMALQYPVSWAAPHIRGDGRKTWAEVATADVEDIESP
jgi:nitrate reductase gamma subunit